MSNGVAQKAKDKEENKGDGGENVSQLPGLSGNLFQLKILMYYLFKMLSSTSFLLGTEMKEAGKFDDLLLKYEKNVEGNKKNHFLLMQCKHKTGKNKIIQPEEILNDGKADFALVKYFNSFVESKNSEMFRNVGIEHVLVFTNAHFNMEWRISGKKKEIWEKLENLRNIIEEMDVKKDSILSLCNIQGGKYYKFKSELVAPVLKEMVLNYSKKLTDDNLDNNVKEFLQKFIFAIEQPDERKLENVISTEIRMKYPKYNTELIYNHFEKEIMNWLITGKFCIKKSEEMSVSKFISSEDAAEFFENKIRKFDTMVLKGPIYDYDHYIQKYNIDFADLELENIIRTFSSSPSKRILNIVSDHIMITSIKLYIKLTNCSTEGLKEFVYVKLSSKLLNLAIDVFDNESTNRCLVMEWDFDETKLEKWTDKINQVIGTIQVYNEKKLIIITNRNDILKKHFPTDMEHVETRDITNKLMDVKNESHDLFLNSEVKFQGYSAKLSDFIINNELKEAIDGSVLDKILKSEDINIGKPMYELTKDVQDCYIERKFICKMENSKNIYLLSGIREDEIFLENYDLEIIEKQEKLTINEINAFEKEEKQNKSIYLLRKEFKKFVLLKKSKSENSFTKADFLNTINYKHDSFEVNLISAEAGMGKSTLLSKLPRDIKYRNHKLWVVKFDLNAMSSKLNKIKNDDKDISFEAVVDFLHHGSNHQSEFEKRIFEYRLQKKNIVLCMDGFDEICPDYKSIVLKIVEVLINEAKINNVWLTTRPYASILNDMKSSFTNCCLKVHNIEPFTESNQKEYLQKLWRPKENGKVYFENFITELFEGLSNNINRRRNEFLGIALHTMLIGVAFKETFEKYQNTNTLEISAQQRGELADMLGLSFLYQKFVMHKWSIQSKEKARLNLDIIAAKTAAENWYAECVYKIKLLALDTLLSENVLNNVLTKEEIKHLMKSKNELNEKGDGIGIVSQITDDKAYFIHQTFAEYFVAIFFVDNLKKEDEEARNFVEYFLNNMINEENAVICDFIDSVLYDESVKYKNKYRDVVSKMDGEKFYFVLKRKWRNIAEILIENEIVLDYEKNRKKIFNLASSVKNLKGRKSILNLILERTKRSRIALKKIFCVYKNDNDSDTNPLIQAIESNTIENVKTILGYFLKNKILKIWMCRTKRRENILHRAIAVGNNDILTYLLEELKAYPEKLQKLLLAKDYYGNTPFDYSLRRSDLGKIEIIWNVLKKEPNNLIEDISWNENKREENILHHAAKVGNNEILVYLLQELKTYPDRLQKLLLKKDRNGITPFDYTLTKRDFEVIKIIWNLLKQEPNTLMEDISWKENKREENILHHVIMHGTDEIIIYLMEELKAYPDRLQKLLLKKDCLGNTPFDYSLRRNLEVIKIIWNLLKMEPNTLKEDISWKENNRGENILHLVIMVGTNEILIYLLEEFKTYPDRSQKLLLGKDCEGNTPFDYIVRSGDLEKINIIWNFLEKEPNVSIENIFWKENVRNENILHHATMVGNNEIFIFLFEKLKNYPDRLQKLLLGKDRDGNTPFIYTVRNGNIEKTEIIWNLLKKEPNMLKEDITWKENNCGENILHHATKVGSDEILIYLLEELKTFPDILRKLLLGKNCDGNTPFDNIVRSGDLEKIKIIWNLLKKEPNFLNNDILWNENNRGENILHRAIVLRSNEIFIYLMEEMKTYPDRLRKLLLGKDYYGNTPFDYTVRRSDLGKIEIIWNVLKKEPNNLIENISWNENNRGENILHHAAEISNNDVLNYLLKELKTYPDRLQKLLLGKNFEGNTPLDYAVIRRDLGVIKIIWNVLEKETNILKEDIPWKANKREQNILHLAIVFSNNEILIYLLKELKTYPNILQKLLLGKDHDGNSPFEYTVRSGDLGKIEIIWNELKKEPNVLKEDISWKENNRGENILHHAAELGDNDVLIYLMEELKTYPDRLQKLLLGKDCDGNTPFHCTVRNENLGKIQIIWNLLKKEPNILIEDIFWNENKRKENIIHRVVVLGTNEILIFLLKELKSNSDRLYKLLLEKDCVGNTCFNYTVIRKDLGKTKIIWNVLKEDINILKEVILWKENKRKQNILHLAILFSSDEILMFLLKELQTYPDILRKLLLDNDCNDNTVFNFIIIRRDLGKTKIIWNVLKEDINMLKEVISWKKNKCERNILHPAILFGNNEILIYLFEELKTYPDILQKLLLGKDQDGNTPFDFTVIKKDLGVIKIIWNLLKEEPNILKEDISWKENKRGENILHHATKVGDNEILIYFLKELKTYPDRLRKLLLTKDCYGKTPFHCTVRNGELEKIKIIWNVLKKELNILTEDIFRIENKREQNILHLTIVFSNNEILNYLVEELKTYPDILQKLLLAKDFNGNTPYDYAVKKSDLGKIEIFRNVLKKEPNISKDSYF